MKKSVTIVFDENIEAHITKGEVKLSNKDGFGFTFELQEIREIYEALISFEQHGQ